MSFISEVLGQLFGERQPPSVSLHRVGGGCINNTGVFEFRDTKYFIKWNKNAHDLFAKEALGLEHLSSKRAISIPEVIGAGQADGFDFLCLSFIEKGAATMSYWELFGRQLAALHRNSSEDYGLTFDNHIGRLPQSNTLTKSWSSFFIEERLTPQIKMAYDAGLLDRDLLDGFEKFQRQLPAMFPEERPALIHGDLWSGNIMCDHQGQPCLFDPATYYGHREAELAFTYLFGGFDSAFYQSYQELFPITAGFDSRIDFYNLYPLLVHVNLFGSSYLAGIKATLRLFA